MPGEKLNEKIRESYFRENILFQKSRKFLSKFEKQKIRREQKEKRRNSLVLREWRLSGQTINQIFCYAEDESMSLLTIAVMSIQNEREGFKLIFYMLYEHIIFLLKTKLDLK